MRTWTLPILILVAAAALSGCGQKGPLYRENPDAAAPSVEETADTSVQATRPDDRKAEAE